MRRLLIVGLLVAPVIGGCGGEDPERAAEMGKAGRKRVASSWTWDAGAERLKELLAG